MTNCLSCSVYFLRFPPWRPRDSSFELEHEERGTQTHPTTHEIFRSVIIVKQNIRRARQDTPDRKYVREAAVFQHSLTRARLHGARLSSPNKVVSQIYNVRLSSYFPRRQNRCEHAGRASILNGRMDSGKRRNDEATARDTPDTLSAAEQMEEPSSFDESLVRNGRLHRAP